MIEIGVNLMHTIQAVMALIVVLIIVVMFFRNV